MVANMGRVNVGSVLLLALFAIVVSVDALTPAPVKAPVAPVKAPVAPEKAPVAPVKAPVAPVKAPVAPVKAPVAPDTAPVNAPVTAPVAPVVFSPAPEPAPLWPPCEGVDLIYITTFTEKIYPYLNDTPWLQPYKFEANVIITNMGYSTVEGWEFGLNYSHGEVSR